MELLKVDLLEEAIEKLNKYVKEQKTEMVELENALGRVVSKDIISEYNVPGFDRSTVDGYAVKASDTQGASENMPSFLKTTGEVLMGEEASFEINSGEACYVPTGGMIPFGADSMVMVEYCENFSKDQIAVYQAVAPGKSIVKAGDDIKKGEIALRRGRKIRPQDIGLLSSIGIMNVECYVPWKLYIISTGDEIIDPSAEPKLGEIRDINTYGLVAGAKEAGFEVVGKCVVKDSPEKLREEIRKGKALSDYVIISGGSSQGKKDSTEKLIGEESTSGVLTHGIAVKPGKPTILGYDEETETGLIGLPGHPVAAMLLFRFIVLGLFKKVTGQEGNFEPKIIGRMTTNIAASPGRKTFQLVTIDEENNITPVLGKSGLIRTMSEASGYIVLDVNSEGINKGAETVCYLI